MSWQDEREFVTVDRMKPKLIDVKYEPLGTLKDGFNCIETYVRWVPFVSTDVKKQLR